jgi:heterotetrameric sarcosine oxidase delta subunit
MIRLTCPNCGPRPLEEWRYGGETPSVPDSVTDPAARNVDRVWFSDNVDGPVVERWYHLAGCRRWTTVLRDTHTDTVLESRSSDGAGVAAAPGAHPDDGGH